MTDKEHYSLLHHNTFGIAATCARYISIDSTDEAQQVLPTLTGPRLLIGEGSNLLLTRDFPGTVIHSNIRGREEKEEEKGEVLLRVGGGERWDDIVAYTVDNGMHGAENLSFIPGNVAAAAAQNIGAYGTEIKDIIDSVETVDITTGEQHIFSRDDCRYAYRDSRFKREGSNRHFITFVTLRLTRTFVPQVSYGGIQRALAERKISTPTAQQMREVIIALRKDKLPAPAVRGNAGSFFKNPLVPEEQAAALQAQYNDMPCYPAENGTVKLSAAWLIEQVGWKGKAQGQAAVYEKQAVVLVNNGGATGQDILALAQTIQQAVRTRFAITLLPEVSIL